MRFRTVLAATLVASVSLIHACACGAPPSPSIAITGNHSVVAGDTIELTATTAGGEDTGYTWSSEAGSIAAVSDGVVTGVAAGETRVVATGNDTAASASHVIVVRPAAPAPPPTVSILGSHRLEIGETITLTAMTTNGSDTGYVWTSDNTTVAEVTGTGGVVSGLTAGEATITVTGAQTGATADWVVVVNDPSIDDGAVVVSGAFYLAIADTTTLTATTVGEDDSGYTWASSDEGVATVDVNTGVVTGVSDGQVTITATGIDSMKSGTLGLYVAEEIPYFDAWAGSGHADHTAEAFARWDGTVSANCARCHSEGGYRDYLGDDGSAVGTVDADAATGSVVNCQTCHNPAATNLASVEFPSGAVIDDMGASMRCMVCHQGRSSTDDVNEAITTAGVGDDVISTDLGFINIHYYAAGATLNAGRARGGYQYDGELYDVRFRHVESRDVCIECHDQHTLEVRIDACKTCHTSVTDVASLKSIRMMSSRGIDYDGDADLTEGIYDEMMGVAAALYERIQAYASEKNTKAICYGDGYPYFFVDTNSNGTCEDTEVAYANAYDEWTPRLVRAAYNYQTAKKDPGAFAHNAKYIIQLVYDSAMDVNGAMSSPIDLSALSRNDPGHFNGAGEAARHWDAQDDEDEGTVSASCSRCHGGAEGFLFYLQYGVGTEVLETDNGLDCATCHSTFADEAMADDRWNTHDVESVLYPTGVELDNGGSAPTNLCSTCHQGRRSGADVERRITSGALGFDNVHYLAAGSTRHGKDVGIAVQYQADVQYSGQFNHPPSNECTYCHDPVATDHTFLPQDNIVRCQLCHGNTITSVREIKKNSRAGVDYDGDTTVETLREELGGIAEDLLAKMAADFDICYDGDVYPYFFTDTNDNSTAGECESSEANYGNAYSTWTDALLRAAFNYQLSHTEHGLWAHNFDYGAQVLIDSILDLGGSNIYVRPTP
jgi:uncharacterized protein YjdB